LKSYVLCLNQDSRSKALSYSTLYAGELKRVLTRILNHLDQPSEAGTINFNANKRYDLHILWILKGVFRVSLPLFVYVLLLPPLLLARGSYNVYFHSPVGPSTLNRLTPENRSNSPQNLANYRRSRSVLRRVEL